MSCLDARPLVGNGRRAKGQSWPRPRLPGAPLNFKAEAWEPRPSLGWKVGSLGDIAAHAGRRLSCREAIIWVVTGFRPLSAAAAGTGPKSIFRESGPPDWARLKERGCPGLKMV